MAGFYNVPFANVAPKAAGTAANSGLFKDSFMDVAECIRAWIYIVRVHEHPAGIV